MTAPANLAAIVAEGERLCREAGLPIACEHIEKGRVFIRDGGLLITVREQVPDGVDPDGDDPDAWEIGDAAVEEAGRRGECIAWAVGNIPLLLRLVKAGDRLYEYAHHAPICTGSSERPCDCGLVEALAAWDAAASAGEGEP